MQADLDFVELHENELSIEMEIWVNSLLEDLKVVEYVLDKLALMFCHLPGELAL